ncbi:guanine deaminase [Sugiyamaella lignohabitans]|uniref:Guanine deaminase n=1 Tax=Sugiyamaella lignohabitans TaxID=796027 RepID=A0A170QZU5_9ASCO|nr:guanine deaminase [Sugiyamaella lignohabitans]ANB16024.1 guanine deaminase [Sugiyamaella lignohabitans]
MDSQESPEFYRDQSPEEANKADLEVIDYITKIDPTYNIVSPILTPRFAPSCTHQSMKWMGDLMKKHNNIPCQTHISENENEIKWVQELFPDSKSYADVYDQAGLLTERTILAHAIHLSEDEKDLISARRSGISHCPISNSSIGSGLAPVRSLLNKNIKMSLGTDVSGGYSPSILEVCRQALTVSRLVGYTTKNDKDKLSVSEVLFLATLGGAQVCNLEHKVGNFQVGKKWDAQRVDLSVENTPIDLFDWYGAEEPTPESKIKWFVDKWFFSGDDRNTRQVWVDGNLVLDKD